MDFTYGVTETKNRKQISDLRGVRIRIFAVLGSGQHIFQRIGTKFPTELRLSNADFVLSGKWDRKYKLDFSDVQIPVFRLVHCGTITPVIRGEFLPNFARYSDVVSWTRVVFLRNRNWISDFRGVQVHILAVFRLWSMHFSTISAKFPVK